MQAGMHTGRQGGKLGCRRGCIPTGRDAGGDAYRLAGREARMQALMHTGRQGGRRGCIQAGREGG